LWYNFAVLLTYRYRIKDGTTAKHLAAMARSVNYIWNYCGEIQNASRRHNKRWPSAFDLIKLTTGSSAMFGVHSDTVQAVCKQFVSSRNLHRRRPKWRGKKSLGWVPFAAARAIKIDEDTAIYLKRRYRFWNNRPVDLAAIHCGCFAADASGRWYLNLHIEVAERDAGSANETGIDLGLATLATCSNGQKIQALQHYRRAQQKLPIAQRARNKRRVTAIHRKIANARKHHLHQQSTRLAEHNRLIVVGNVNAKALTRTRMAKSVLDASWSAFRAMLRYKLAMRRGVYVEVDERWTSQTCSSCGVIPASSPKGMGALGMRHWVCSGCGASHDRDVNAAINILRVGRERSPLVAEIPALKIGEGVTK
jgi:putative transposase